MKVSVPHLIEFGSKILGYHRILGMLVWNKIQSGLRVHQKFLRRWGGRSVEGKWVKFIHEFLKHYAALVVLKQMRS
jgi:hypothetical protein